MANRQLVATRLIATIKRGKHLEIFACSGNAGEGLPFGSTDDKFTEELLQELTIADSLGDNGTQKKLGTRRSAAISAKDHVAVPDAVDKL
jgi:hypothetical protein